jgi:hypothetical protein
MIAMNPMIPDVNKLIAFRMLLRCNRNTPNEINAICPLTTFEKKAYEYLTIVNL